MCQANAQHHTYTAGCASCVRTAIEDFQRPVSTEHDADARMQGLMFVQAHFRQQSLYAKYDAAYALTTMYFSENNAGYSCQKRRRLLTSPAAAICCDAHGRLA